jgi:hypothetical protein
MIDKTLSTTQISCNGTNISVYSPARSFSLPHRSLLVQRASALNNADAFQPRQPSVNAHALRTAPLSPWVPKAKHPHRSSVAPFSISRPLISSHVRNRNHAPNVPRPFVSSRALTSARTRQKRTSRPCAFNVTATRTRSSYGLSLLALLDCWAGLRSRRLWRYARGLRLGHRAAIMLLCKGTSDETVKDVASYSSVFE